MNWETIAILIARYGIDLAYKLIANANSNTPVTPASLDELRKLVKPYDQYIAEARERAGLPPT